jgi:hypothetical protein
MSKGKNKNNIEVKVKDFMKRDGEGFFYIPMCNNTTHLGIIKDEDVCIQRCCNHYDRYYLKSQYTLLREFDIRINTDGRLNKEK